MESPVLYLPIVTTVLSLGFGWRVLQRYRERGRPPHLLWWGAGILLFGVGTFTEGFTAVFGWHEPIFRAWYISGALMGGAPLAQGTVYLLLPRRVANRLTAALITCVVAGSVLALLTPLDLAAVEDHHLSPKVIEWTWIRAISPFINTYAFIFLVGGALYSAMRYSEQAGAQVRVAANVLIAVGAILPGIGGTFTRMGYTEVLYVTEFLGIILIYLGYRLSIRPRNSDAGLLPGNLRAEPAD